MMSKKQSHRKKHAPLERPVISEILLNFLELKYSTVPKNVQETAQTICKLILKQFNSIKIPPPPNDLDSDEYKKIYARYQSEIAVTQSKCKIIEVFGRSILRKQFKVG